MRLSHAPRDYRGRIVSVQGEEFRERLLEMGFVPGESVRILQKLYGGDPVIVEVQNISIALRLEEAACVEVCGVE